MQINKTSNKLKTKDLVETALLTALVFVATSFIHFTLPGGVGGLIHLGTAMLFIVSIVFGGKKGAIAGAIGMTIFDLLGGWILWAPCTFVVKGLMAYIVGSIAWANNKEGKDILYNIIATVVAGVWMIAGYYIWECIILHSFISPLASIPGNIIQIVVGIVVAIPLSIALKKYFK